MSIVGTVRVTCPACGVAQDARLMQSINSARDPAAKQRLLGVELNVHACACGKRVQLAANLLFHDPIADYYCQVVAEGEPGMANAAQKFRAVGATGVQRLVPSQNALIEKVKLLDAGLEDWAIELVKVVLLAPLGEPELGRVLVFDRVDRKHQLLHWILFDPDGRGAQRLSSPLTAYARLAARTQGAPAPGELQIDRAWAIERMRSLITQAN